MSTSAEAEGRAAGEFRLATAALPEAHLLVTRGGEIVGANPAADRMLRLAEGAPGASLAALVRDPPERLSAYLHACAASGALLPGALSLPNGDGGVHRYRCDGAAARLRGAGAEPLVLLRFRPQEQASRRFHLLNQKIDELASEIHQRRRAEDALRAHARALEETAAELERQRAEATRAREAAERAAERLRVLAEAGRLLTASLDAEAALQGLAELCASTLADYAVTYLCDGDEIRRVGVAHADGAQAPLVGELLRQPAPSLEDRAGAGAVVRTGEPVLVERIPPEMLAEAAGGDEAYLALLRRLAPRSSVIVPLRAGSRVLGALAAATVEGGRSALGADDLALLQQLAGRAALLVEGARAHADLGVAHELLQQQASELEMQAEELQVQAAEMEAAQAELEEANQELQRANRELRQQGRIAEAARAEAEEANRAKAQFLATMSHELRTPLNAIGGYVDLIELEIHGPVTDAQRRGLERVRRNQRHLLTLINDILNFARLEAGQVEFDRAAVPVEALLANLESLVEPQLQARGLAYSCAGCDPALAVWGDEERIHQILINLLTNATKFTHAGGRIAIDCVADGEWVRVRVHDDGPGIPADRIHTIFDPFVQLNRRGGAGGEQGVGLGLAISRDLARRMEGDLTVESVEGDGAVFTLTLPRAAG